MWKFSNKLRNVLPVCFEVWHTKKKKNLPTMHGIPRLSQLSVNVVRHKMDFSHLSNHACWVVSLLQPGPGFSQSELSYFS